MNPLHAGARVGVLATIATLAACEGHGKYTSEFLDKATGDMSRLRAATQYDMALQQFHSGDLGNALDTIDNSIALNDEVANSYLLKGRILLERGLSQAAIEVLEQGAELDRNEPDFHYYCGIARERVGEFDEALAAYEKSAAIDPTDAQYLLAASEVLIELDRLAEARELLEGQTGDFESNAGFRQALGHIALLEGKNDEAVHFFTEAAVLCPSDSVLREDLCLAQIAARRFVEAEATLRRLSKEAVYHERRDLQHVHASCLLELDRPVEARTILHRLVRGADGPTDIEAWIKLIDVAIKLRDDDLLHATASRLLATAPGRHEGYLALALWQCRNGELQAALRSLDRAADRANGDPAPKRLQAIIQGEIGRDS